MSSLDQVELRRQQLEENVAKLRKSLQHWRTWDAEYEGLKEELARSNARTEEDCTLLSDQLEGELVNREEIFSLFGVGKGTIREVHQVIGFVDRRQDYVQKNIETISKQIHAAENEIERLDEKINRSDANDNSSGPLTEIIEELDEEGNVISSHTTQPESATDQILATLRKAGLNDLDAENKVTGQSQQSTTKVEPSKDTAEQAKNGEPSCYSVDGSTTAASQKSSNVESSKDARKSVIFADDIQEKTIPNIEDVEVPLSATKRPDPSLISGSFDSNDRVIELDDDDEIVGATPVIPGNESPEDAHLRREMLQYSLNEIGSVVAELDLEEDYSDDEDDEDFEFDDDGSLSELSEEEDEHGRSLKKGVTSKYRQQMLELEERLMARMIENVGPEPDENNPEIDREDLRQLVIRDDGKKESTDVERPASTSALAKDPATKKKGVRFADSLNVSEAPQAKTQASIPEAAETKPAPIINNVVERRAPSASSAQEEVKKPARVSRFKKDRENTQPSEPGASTKPEVRPILSDTIVEKPATFTPAPSLEAHEFDSEIQQRQLASEYYRMRNNMIRQQGGFKAIDEETDQPLMEEIDGKVKKVSRFKAARLR